MATKQAKQFKIKVHLSLRYILRFHSDDAEFEAECIDAGATGLGATQQEALQDLIVNLNATHQVAVEHNLTMLTPARPEDESLYAKLAARQPVEPSVLGYGVIQHVEFLPAAADRKAKKPAQRRFEIGQHTSLAA
ncbi:MAG: hypothetical protein K8I27_01865 [Planctomycetes bacterium]|nr:hypothetical protein [Planctomycetota bacterium]